MSNIASVTEETFAEEVLNSPKPVMVKFWAPWCGPCIAMNPIVDKLSEANPDVSFVQINVDENPNLASQYGIASIPNILFVKDGNVVSQSIGLKNRNFLQTEVDKLLAN